MALSLEEIIEARPLLNGVLVDIEQQRDRAADDPAWCFYEAWYHGGLHQRAHWALWNEDPRQSANSGLSRMDDLLDRPSRQHNEMDDEIESSWWFVAEQLTAMLPRCGPTCECPDARRARGIDA